MIQLRKGQKDGEAEYNIPMCSVNIEHHNFSSS